MTHCYGQALQLADGDAIKVIKIIRRSLDAAGELTKVDKCSILFRIIGKKSNTLRKGKELPAG